jgi:hypothetical protein
MEQKFGKYVATFNPNLLNDELARLDMNNPDQEKVISKADALKEFSPLYKIRSLIASDRGEATPARAMASSYRPVLSRNINCDPATGWTVKEVTMTKGVECANFTLVLPPSRPLFLMIGKSHIRNMANINFQYNENCDVKHMYERTAYVILPDGTAPWFAIWCQMIHATLTGELCDRYPSFTTEDYHPCIWLMSPFSWHLDRRDEGLSQSNEPWPKRVARYLMKASTVLAELFEGNP